MVKKSYTLLFFLVFNALFLSSNIYADSCSTCYAQHETVCEKRCSRIVPESRERCYKPCLLNHCKNLCGYEDTSNGVPSSSSNVIDCDYCQRRASQDCIRTCEGKGSSCSKRCLSNACRSHCGLPAPPASVLQKNQAPEKQCRECKTQKEHGCKTSCGSGPGSLSCSVACVERKCSQECLID
jgi:hypothetical protein